MGSVHLWRIGPILVTSLLHMNTPQQLKLPL